MKDRTEYKKKLAAVIAGCATDILNNAQNIADRVDLPTGDVTITINIPAENNHLPEIEISSTHYSVTATERYWESKIIDLSGPSEDQN